MGNISRAIRGLFVGVAATVLLLFILFVRPATAEDAPSPWESGWGPDVVDEGSIISNTTLAKTWTNTNTTSPTKTRSLQNTIKGRAGNFYLRILPLGASITYGVESSDGNGYRKHLRDRLRFAGWKVNMVGTQEGGRMADRQNQGHPGWKISEIHQAARNAVAAGIRPNLVLINAGTNDCIWNDNPGSAGARMKSMIDYIFLNMPGTTVLLSTLVPHRNGVTESCVVSVNAQYRSLVTQYRSAGNNKIYLADMHAYLNQDDILPDQTHPNDFGYKKMASVWWDAFLNVEANITPPDNSINDANDALRPTCAKVAGNGIGPVQVQRGSGFEDGKYKHSATSRGTILTESLAAGIGIKAFHWANLVGATDRGAELDDLISVDNQTDGTWRYRLRVNNGNNNFAGWTTFTVPGLSCPATAKHLFGDFNNDGLDDVWCINTNGAASVAINQGGNPPIFSSIGQVMSAKSGTYPTDMVLLGDIDGDGRVDYCLVDNNGDVRCWRNGGQSNTVSLWQGFATEDGFGGVVFPTKNMGNRARVRLEDLNGDFRTDWMWIGDQGQVTTYINQRGWGLGIVPNWVSTGQTHAGMGVDGAGNQVKFGRVYGSGRVDYTWFKPTANGQQVQIQVWENKGSGGTRVRGDGAFYCDMTGDGSEDYIWVWSDGHAAELYINNHNVPYWEIGSKTLFNIARSRRSIHIADWNGDGRCDILSQRKSDGALELWRNDYNALTRSYTFTPMGLITGALCSEGWGVNVLDHGMQLADIDGDGRADALCLEKNGRITGWLNKASGLENVGQVKYTEGWDRANMRFADVENGGKADLVWINKYNGEVTVLKNKGRIPASGSAFTWEKRGVLYSSVGERGPNIRLVNLGGIGRADLLQLLPISNRAFVWWNRCGGSSGGGDDGPIVDPGLPGYSSGGGGGGGGGGSPQACIDGTGPWPYTGLCQIICKLDYCPQPCECTQRGTAVPRPSPTSQVPGGAKPGFGGIFHQMCAFSCENNNCLDEYCRRLLCMSGDGDAKTQSAARGVAQFFEKFVKEHDDITKLAEKIWEESPVVKDPNAISCDVPRGECPYPEDCLKNYDPEYIDMYWAQMSMANFHKYVTHFEEILKTETMVKLLNISEITAAFPTSEFAEVGTSDYVGMFSSVLGLMGAAAGYIPKVGEAASGVIGVVGGIIGFFTDSEVSQPEVKREEGDKPKDMMEKYMGAVVTHAVNGVQRMLKDLFYDGDISGWPSALINTCGFDSPIANFFCNGRFYNDLDSASYANIRQTIAEGLQTSLVGVQLKAGGWWILVDAYSQDQCNAGDGGLEPQHPTNMWINGHCYSLEGLGYRTPDMYDGSFDASHNMFSKPFSEGTFDLLVELGRYGVTLPDLYLNSERCQRRDNKFDGSIDLTPDIFSQNPKMRDCFYSLPVLYVRPQTLQYFEGREVWGGLQSTPCHVLAMGKTFTDEAQQVAGKTFLPEKIKALMTGDNEWYCCYKERLDRGFRKLCPGDPLSPPPEWF